MNFYLNEYSLCGQFATIEDFVTTEIGSIYRCIMLVKKGNLVIINSEKLKDAFITKEERLSDLGRIKQSEELLQLQLCLQEEAYSDRYWENSDQLQQDMDAIYVWNENDVSLTSMAEAAASDSPLLSCAREGLTDQKIRVQKKKRGVDNIYNEIQSIHTEQYLVEKYGENLALSRDDVLKIRYRGTRIDYTTIESEHGADQLEKNEYNSLIGTLDKFIGHESFNSIDLDDGLEYKKYSPSQSEWNRFSGGKYRNMQIIRRH